MLDLTLQDYTQRLALAELGRTEQLLSSAASRLSGRSREAEIVAMPDLGMPHNVQRILGGFFTGALYRWESDVPMVPVDATVNVCGVSVFRLSEPFQSAEDFTDAIHTARRNLDASSLVWNYETGNHFVSWCTVDDADGILPDGHYLVLHASPAEFKSQFNGLYPSPGNWYHDSIIEHIDARVPGRRLRLLTGSKADRFARWAKLLEALYHERQEFIASILARGDVEPVLSVLHYGMPTAESVAIGCNWLPLDEPAYLLLTEPGAPLFLIESFPGGANTVELDRKRILTPHGLGVRVADGANVSTDGGRLTVGRAVLTPDESLRDTDLIAIRPFEGGQTIASILDKCPGAVRAQLNPVASHHRTSQVHT